MLSNLGTIKIFDLYSDFSSVLYITADSCFSSNKLGSYLRLCIDSDTRSPFSNLSLLYIRLMVQFHKKHGSGAVLGVSVEVFVDLMLKICRAKVCVGEGQSISGWTI